MLGNWIHLGQIIRSWDNLKKNMGNECNILLGKLYSNVNNKNEFEQSKDLSTLINIL